MQFKLALRKISGWSFILGLFAVFSLAGCGGGGGGSSGGGGTVSYTVGGTVSGLTGPVTLQNGSDHLTFSTTSNFTFAIAVSSGTSYNITVSTQPPGQTCIVTGGSGTVSGNVSNVSLSCSNNTYTVGGSVSGLTGSVVLRNNGGDNLTVSGTSFSFATPVAHGGTYNVTVFTQPGGQTCTVSAGAGTVSTANVANVAVVCATNAYSVGGTVTGLAGSLVLQDNNGDNFSTSADGGFSFATPVADGSPYSVTVLTQPTNQSCSVASGAGTIATSNVTNVLITCATNTYTIGGTVTGLAGSMVLQDNGGDNYTVSSNTTFTFPTALAYGSAYNVTLFSQQFANQTCTITGGSGTVSGNITGVAVNCVTPAYAFTANYTDNSVSTYKVNGSTGGLTNLGKVAAGAGPYSVTVDPLGKYAYVTNFFHGAGGDSVSQYTIDANGALAPMTPATVAAGINPSSVTIDPSGKYVYVVNQGGNTVSQYTIGAGGALTPMSTATVPAGSVPSSVTIDPSGKYVYVANYGLFGIAGGSISQYTIGAGGSLTPMTPATVAAGTNPTSVTVDSLGKYAYVANQGSNSVSQYTIGAGGALTPMASPTVATGTIPVSVTVDPSGRYAYVANGSISGTVSQYTIGAAGGLAPMTPATVAAGANPYSITVDPSGKYAYVANYNYNRDAGKDTVSQYTIGAGGALTPLTPASVADAPGPTSITVTTGH